MKAFRSTLARLCLPVMLASSLPAAAEETGDPQMGKRLAQDVCVECHAVDPDDTLSLNMSAPSFQEIADQPEITPLALAVWFRSPHPTMPNFVLPADEASDIIAYILSLRKE